VSTRYDEKGRGKRGTKGGNGFVRKNREERRTHGLDRVDHGAVHVPDDALNGERSALDRVGGREGGFGRREWGKGRRDRGRRGHGGERCKGVLECDEREESGLVGVVSC
jgi:hypothetical protein